MTEHGSSRCEDVARHSYVENFVGADSSVYCVLFREAEGGMGALLPKWRSGDVEDREGLELSKRLSVLLSLLLLLLLFMEFLDSSQHTYEVLDGVLDDGTRFCQYWQSS